MNDHLKMLIKFYYLRLNFICLILDNYSTITIILIVIIIIIIIIINIFLYIEEIN